MATAVKRSTSRRSRTKPEKSGQLRAADPFDLIRLLARSQHDPRKAVAELIQNSLDAGARHVQVSRFQRRGIRMLSIWDDGQGVLGDMARQEALTHIATNIGHSRKRELSVQDRYRLLMQGQYGIGLLGFWSVGRTLRIRSKVGQEPAYVLQLEEDSPRYEIYRDREEFDFEGTWTDVQIVNLHETASRQLAGPRLCEYLSEELRGQLLEREVELRIVDRLRPPNSREFEVKPRRFKGVRLRELSSLAVPGYAPARLELYDAAMTDEPAKVNLLSNGTVVVDNISDLEGFDEPPWNLRRLSGFVDFSGLHVAPGTRRSFVPDASSDVFLTALKQLAQPISEALAQLDDVRQRSHDGQLVRQLHRIFRDFPTKLPYYRLFDVNAEISGSAEGDGSSARPDSEEEPAPQSESMVPLVVAREALDPAPAWQPNVPQGPVENHVLPPEDVLPLPLSGPLSAIEVVPNPIRIPVGKSCLVRAVAKDQHGHPISHGVRFVWESLENDDVVIFYQAEPDASRSTEHGAESIEGAKIRIQAGNIPGSMLLHLSASEDGVTLESIVSVEVYEQSRQPQGPVAGIPEPEPVHAPEATWRSRAVGNRWEYNTAHADYLASIDDPKRKLKYMSLLLAKEIVAQNSPLAESDAMLERMVEVLTWIEQRLAR